MNQNDTAFGTCGGCGKRMEDHDRVEIVPGSPVLFCPDILQSYEDDGDESTPDN